MKACEVTSLTQADAMRVLRRITDEPGIVGISARFALSRVILG
jgi:hypothetical protein